MELNEMLPDQGVKGVELALLGSIFRWPACFDDVRLIVSADDFRYGPHLIVFEAMQALADRNQIIDMPSTFQVISQAGKALDAPATLLADAWDKVATGASAEQYAKVVKAERVRRDLVLAGHQIIQDAREGLPAAECLDRAESAVYAIGEARNAYPLKTLNEAIGESLLRLDDLQTGRAKGGVKTGFGELDALTGGMQCAELAILAARPSVGKTALACSLIRHAAGNGVPVFFASLEQKPREIADRLLAREGGIPSHLFRSGRIFNGESERLRDARDALHQLAPIHIDESAHQTVSRIFSNARRLKRKAKIGLVVIDYLQLIAPDNPKDPRHEQVSKISRRLKAMAKDLDLPVVALAQVSRAVEGRSDPRPRLSDLKESGGIEENADTVILLHRPDDKPNLLEVILAKQRNGPTGFEVLEFEKEFFRFRPHVPEYQEADSNGHL
jgi:replicative DNA helicase